MQAQPQLGDALAYRIWTTMIRSQGASQKRYHTQEMSAKPREILDRLPWDKALQKRVATFVYTRVKFLTEEGRWVAANGNHIPVKAGDCRRCTSVRGEEGKRKQWHFQCPHWS